MLTFYSCLYFPPTLYVSLGLLVTGSSLSVCVCVCARTLVNACCCRCYQSDWRLRFFIFSRCLTWQEWQTTEHFLSEQCVRVRVFSESALGILCVFCFILTTATFSPPSQSKHLHVCVSSTLDLNLPLRQRQQWLIYWLTQTASKCLPQSEQLNASSLFLQGLAVLKHTSHE